MSLSLCIRCRFALQRTRPESWLLPLSSTTPLIQYTPRRYRSGDSSSRGKLKFAKGPRSTKKANHDTPPPSMIPRIEISISQEQKDQQHRKEVNELFQSSVMRWVNDPATHTRLKNFGVPWAQIRPLLVAYSKAAVENHFLPADSFHTYGLERLWEKSNLTGRESTTDRICTNIFYAWASTPSTQASLLSDDESLAAALNSIKRLYEVADLTHASERYPLARRIRRKIIMHVGPTNSGKTHNALRALAGANYGIYAGPLRLLAHEIWERLNLGQIAPLGVEEQAEGEQVMESLNANGAADSTVDLGDGKPTARLIGNPKWARPCNMVTGEEQKIVSEGAPLLSCTVEMVSLAQRYDVAVIDEIQMIADAERGGAWTQALLGLRADVIHLCGEETAVPVIEAMLKETGDVLEVNRYERLTPLTVEKESLKGDLGKIRKGDCMVVFSRSGIFALKRKIEEKTGLRCAVAYGKLPPEIRSEQAALFNDPESGYDVMVGSDAIGMGLNLKIKRIIFEAVTKFNGATDEKLSVSQAKQIAGRAGRYGLNGQTDAEGLVTTLWPADLPYLAHALAQPSTPYKHARLSLYGSSFTDVAKILPPGSTSETIYDIHMHVSSMDPIYKVSEYNKINIMTQVIDDIGEKSSLPDRLQFMLAPIPWGDPFALRVVEQYVHMHERDMNVLVEDAMRDTDYLSTLLRTETLMQRSAQPSERTAKDLTILESLHKLIVLYLWLSYRNPVVYSEHDKVGRLKERAEAALEWILEGSYKDGRKKQKVDPVNWMKRRERDKKQEAIPYITGFKHRLAESQAQEARPRKTAISRPTS